MLMLIHISCQLIKTIQMKKISILIKANMLTRRECQFIREKIKITRLMLLFQIIPMLITKKALEDYTSGS